MQLDINPAWMSYMYYKPAPSTSDPTPVNLLPAQPEPADRYYSVNSRDFTAVWPIRKPAIREANYASVRASRSAAESA